MGNKRKITGLEIINIIYFLLMLFVIGTQFLQNFEYKEQHHILTIFHHYVAVVMLILSIIIALILIIKSKVIKNANDFADISKSIAATLNILLTSFQFIATLWGIFSIENLSIPWSKVIIYVCLVLLIIEFLIYAFIISKIADNFSIISLQTLINRYIIFVVTAGIILGIIIPNITFHFAIMNKLSNY